MSDLDDSRIDLDKAFFEGILVGWLKKITKDKSILESQNGQLLILCPLADKILDYDATACRGDM